MPSGRNNKAVRSARSVVRAGKRPKPWGTIAAVLVVVVFAGLVFGYTLTRQDFTPSADNQDPAADIDGIEVIDYPNRGHVDRNQRVAYDRSPAFGGPHDSVWAVCNGMVYEQAVRTENMVHSLEHGAVWIAYNPDRVSGGALDQLRRRVEGQQYIMMSPYPGLDSPISLQSWGHQLKVDSADDERIDQFINGLRLNPYTFPEQDATCDAAPAQPGSPPPFDPANPPPFDGSPPGPDAVNLDFSGNTGGEPMGGQPPGDAVPLPEPQNGG